MEARQLLRGVQLVLHADLVVGDIGDGRRPVPLVVLGVDGHERGFVRRHLGGKSLLLSLRSCVPIDTIDSVRSCLQIECSFSWSWTKGFGFVPAPCSVWPMHAQPACALLYCAARRNEELAASRPA